MDEKPEDYGKMIIEGGERLSGSVETSGAKNAALPVMVASLLSSGGKTKLTGLPMVADVLSLEATIKELGVKISLSRGNASIDASALSNHRISLELSKRMRASVLVAGPLLARVGEVLLSEPGGCVIGSRPIDLHLMGFKSLGARVTRLDKNYLKIEAKRLVGSEIHLPFPSVGATENIIMTASVADGRTTIINAAREPEIIDLADFLIGMGARITGAGTSVVRIDGVKELEGISYKVIPDRIEAGTFIIAAAVTKGEIEIKNVIPEHLVAVMNAVKNVGAEIRFVRDPETVVVTGKGEYRALDIMAGPYPGFPTDLQPLLASLLSRAHGVSMIKDTVFPERFRYVDELRKMGADIAVMGNSARVKGVDNLYGAEVSATDLRAGAALVLAGLAAKGRTVVNNVYHIERGYERLDEKLVALGARMSRIPPPSSID